MPFAKLRSSAGTRLAAVYALLFGLSVAALGGICVALVDVALHRQMDRRISAEMDELLALHAAQGPAALADAIRARESGSRDLYYRLETATGTRIAGGLAPTGRGPGWFSFDANEGTGDSETADSFRAQSATVGGNILTVADDMDEIDDMRVALAGIFAAAAAAAAVLAIAGGIWLSRLYLLRLGRLGATAEAVTGGDLAQRMPLSGSGDEFDRVSVSLNRMLDRNAALLDSQRQITSDIAHDMRTPLSRLRHTIEAGMQGRNPAALADALEEVDGLLEVFSSMLRIAEIEEGARTAKFAPADLAQIAGHVGDAFAAPFDEQGKVLTVAADPGTFVHGDRELLAQLLSNLVENALVHTPPGTCAAIEVRRSAAGPTLTVRDDGPGVPESERMLIFQRFRRLDASRNRAGHGLGLSLVRAIALLHGANLAVEDARPGLAVVLRWQASRT